MRLFRYWSKHEQVAKGPWGDIRVRCFGFSNDSIEDALAVARQRAERAAARWANNTIRNDTGDYYDRPIREEIIESFDDSDQCIAAITRNAYGALILNTPVMFIADVDLPRQGSGCLLPRLFGKKNDPAAFDEQLVDRVKSVVRDDSSLRIRMYRTNAGFRIVITSRQINARDAKSERILEALGADRLYVALCRSQDCYRARLTPKPWRIGIQQPTTRFPFDSADIEQQHRRWEAAYDQARHDFATCALIGEFGDAPLDPIIDKILRLHDHYTLDESKPLA